MFLDDILSVLKKSRKILILPHISVDGDCLGSSIALALALKRLGKEAVVFVEEEIPYVYGFLTDDEIVRTYSHGAYPSELAVALDTGDIERLGNRADIFNAAVLTVNIDHHSTNSEYALYNYVQSSSAAVGEIIYTIIKMLGVEIDSRIAECLYVALVADTGGFRYSNTTSTTHKIAAELISMGINVSEISQRIFENTSLIKTKLTGLAIGSLQLYHEGKTAVITLTDKDMEKVGAKDEDCDGIVNLGRNITGVEVAVMIRQLANGILKVNLRSKAYVDVASIASMFGGGGHKRAAGCMLDKELEKFKVMLLEDIKEAL